MDYHPEDWHDVLAYLIVGLPAIIAAIGTSFFHQRKELKVQRRIAEDTLYEVKNEHRSNLRDDIDDLAVAIKEGFNNVKSDISGLREELRTERLERIEGDRRHQ